MINRCGSVPVVERSRSFNNRRRSERISGLAASVSKAILHLQNSYAFAFLLISSERLWECMIVEHNAVPRNCSNYEGLRAGYFEVTVRAAREHLQLFKAISLILPSPRQPMEWK